MTPTSITCYLRSEASPLLNIGSQGRPGLQFNLCSGLDDRSDPGHQDLRKKRKVKSLDSFKISKIPCAKKRITITT